MKKRTRFINSTQAISGETDQMRAWEKLVDWIKARNANRSQAEIELVIDEALAFARRSE
jgi:hypothetical protein